MKDYAKMDCIKDKAEAKLYSFFEEVFDEGYKQGFEDGKKEQLDDEIKIGNEVINSLDRWFVTKIVDNGTDIRIHGVDKNGTFHGEYKENVRKTGRHFPQIAEVLKQMQEVEDADSD